MSCTDCAPDSGVSITGLPSVYIVFGCTPLKLIRPSRNFSDASPFRIEALIDAAPVYENPFQAERKLVQWLNDFSISARSLEFSQFIRYSGYIIKRCE